ncbi:MAG TPA: hypothetical protein H9748_07130 [Candidatus Mediterraneibacter norwichensis]|nr:hypothetical protein [Candidatus Mediterraneibacter norwichensis]
MIHLLVYISTAAAAVLSIIQAGKQILPWIAGIVVYVLAAVLLTLSCVFFYHDLRENVIKKILEVIKKNPLGERFLADYTFRTILTTLPAFLINVAYTVYNGVIGIMNQSVWFITMAVVNMVKVRKTKSPILITIRNIGAADALVSMLTLQAAMFASFQDKNSLNTNQMNAITGLSVCILISILGISMIWYAWKKKKES